MQVNLPSQSKSCSFSQALRDQLRAIIIRMETIVAMNMSLDPINLKTPPYRLAFPIREEQEAPFIEWAFRCAEEGGTTIDHFLIRNELISAELLYESLASILHVAFTTDMLPVAPSFDGLTLLKAEACLLDDVAQRPYFVIAPTGKNFTALLFAASIGALSLTGENVVLTTPHNFIRSIRSRYGKGIAEKAVNAIKTQAPYLSAYPSGKNRITALSITLLLFLCLSFALPQFCYMLIFALTLFPGLPSIILKAMALRNSKQIKSSYLLLIDQNLPSYTILVPLFREQKIIPLLIERLNRIDYPKAKLEIKILVEMDDIETRLALMMQELPSIFDIIVCPLMSPRTKPRALNIGLAYAKGDYIVVYDAEDEPDADQLKKVATFFDHADRKMGCVQCRLAIDNMADAWISRMFALEYAGLFDALLPGMSKAHQPIPLGGTSNHFRRSTLEACFAWDPWNVTEDADLGLRLARLGYETAVIDSTTWEEAPNTLKAWINQRTRWLKGWMQTAMVLARPNTARHAHPSRVIQWQIIIISLASITSAMFNPLIVACIGWSIAVPSTDEGLSLFEWAQWSLVGVIFMFHCSVSYLTLKMGAHRRSWKFCLSDSLGMALYSVLKCIAAWRALWEFMVAPSHWRKTEHGHSRTSQRVAPRRS